MQILFENTDMLIVNKLAGLLTHADAKGNKPTITDWIAAERPEIIGVGEQMTIDGKMIDRPGIVHRLDEETSGALVIAKTHAAYIHLKQQFKDRLVTKEYHAVIWGQLKESSMSVAVPIGRSSGDFRKWQAGRGTRGEVREAITLFEQIGVCEVDTDHFSLIKAFPKTGRTHQIRAHLKYLQRPIVGDTLYGGKQALGFERVALHARKITISGLDGQQISVEAPYPIDFAEALAKYPFA